MATTPFTVDPVQLAGSATTHYTTPAATRARIDACSLTNTTAGPVTATLHLVPSGGSASAANCVCSAKSIPAGQTHIPPGVIGHWLEPGGTFQALASAATSITLALSGVEYT